MLHLRLIDFDTQTFVNRSAGNVHIVCTAQVLPADLRRLDGHLGPVGDAPVI